MCRAKQRKASMLMLGELMCGCIVGKIIRISSDWFDERDHLNDMCT